MQVSQEFRELGRIIPKKVFHSYVSSNVLLYRDTSNVMSKRFFLFFTLIFGKLCRSWQSLMEMKWKIFIHESIYIIVIIDNAISCFFG